MITPIYRDKDGCPIGFMPIGQAIMESGMDQEDWDNPVRYGRAFVPVEDLVASSITGEEMGGRDFEDALIDRIDRGIPCTDIFRNQYYSTRYVCDNPHNRTRAWHDRNFCPAEAVHPIHRDGNLHFLSLAQHRKIKEWNVEVVAA